MRLYKYRSLTGPAYEYTLDVIRKRQLYFSSPDKFNDPFEFRPIISMECTDAEFSSYLDGLYARRMPWMNRTQRRESVAAVMRDKSRNHRSTEAAKVMTESMAQLTRKCGVFCLSEDPANLLMWAHYADCHAGICIGFDGASTNTFFGRAQSVSYSSAYPVVNIIRDHPKSFHEKGVLTKADFWAYEKEWRIIEHEKGAGVYQFNVNDMEEIVFGLNTPAASVSAVKAACTSAGIYPRYYRVRPHATEFRLELVDDNV